jgi:hypothetical protein
MQYSQNYIEHRKRIESLKLEDQPYYKQKIPFYVNEVFENTCLWVRTQLYPSEGLIIPFIDAQVCGGWLRGDISLQTTRFRLRQFFEQYPDPEDIDFVVHDERHVILMEKYGLKFRKSDHLLDSPWLNEVHSLNSTQKRSERIIDLLPNQKNKIQDMIKNNSPEKEINYERNVLERMIEEIELYRKMGNRD